MMLNIALLGLLNLLANHSTPTELPASQSPGAASTPPLHWLGEDLEPDAPPERQASETITTDAANLVSTGPAPLALPPWPEVRQFARQLLADNARLTLQLTRQGQNVTQWQLAPAWVLLVPSHITIQLEQNGDRLTARFVDPRPKLRYEHWHLLDQSVLSVQVTLSEVLLDLSGPIDWRFPLPKAAAPPKPTSPPTEDPAEDNLSAVIPPLQPLQKQPRQSQRPTVKLPVAKQKQVRQPLNRPPTMAPK